MKNTAFRTKLIETIYNVLKEKEEDEEVEASEEVDTDVSVSDEEEVEVEPRYPKREGTRNVNYAELETPDDDCYLCKLFIILLCYLCKLFIIVLCCIISSSVLTEISLIFVVIFVAFFATELVFLFWFLQQLCSHEHVSTVYHY